MPGGPAAQNGKEGPKWPELCIKTVIRLCTGCSQNHHPCLPTLPFRTGRYLLFRNLANVCRGPKNGGYATVLYCCHTHCCWRCCAYVCCELFNKYSISCERRSGMECERTLAISSAALSRPSSSRLTCAACSSELSIYRHTHTAFGGGVAQWLAEFVAWTKLTHVGPG